MFYDTLQNLCCLRGTTVTGLLKELKLSTSKGSAWHEGSVPNGVVLAKIAEYFNVTTDYLLGIDNPKASDPASDDAIKFALFGGDDEISDAMYDEVKNFAAYVKQREKDKKSADK